MTTENPYPWADGMDCAVTVCDTGGTILYMNDKARTTFARHGDMVGKNLFDCHGERSREIIRRLLAAQESRASSVNDLCRLWIALSLLDPRVAVKERALLECIALQKQHRSIIQTDVAVPFCYYALLLMREGRKEQALAVVQLGRSLSTDNVILKFLESGAEWTV